MYVSHNIISFKDMDTFLRLTIPLKKPAQNIIPLIIDK